MHRAAVAIGTLSSSGEARLTHNKMTLIVRMEDTQIVDIQAIIAHLWA